MTKTFLVIGRTGVGKSSLGNLLTDSDSFLVSSEGSDGRSTTRHHSVAEFKIAGSRYRFVDTIGIGDTELQPSDLLKRLARACYECRDGIAQVLFVTKDRFTADEIEAFNILRQVLFDDRIVQYTTIVRTNFRHFSDFERCNRDTEALKNSSNYEVSEIFKRVFQIVHIDIPPPDQYGSDTARQMSRSKMLVALQRISPYVYKPSNLDRINARIEDFCSREDELDEQMQLLAQREAELEALSRQQQQYASRMADALRQQRERQEIERERRRIEEEQRENSRGLSSGMMHFFKKKCTIM